MIDIKDKRNCCGCSACVSTCPKGCIVMKEDEEGFLYPEVDKEKCIGCGLCDRICPVLHPCLETTKPQKAYIAQHKDDTILRESTSGGAFSAIGKQVIEKGGVVFGAGFNKDFEVTHQYVEQVEDLKVFRNSKYVQSRIGDCYLQAKQFLESGKQVCFSGTPCQIEGLLSFLHKPYEKLITVDVVCRACPSPLVLRKYLEMQRHTLKIDLTGVRFRDKYHGYKYSAMSLYDKNSNDYHQGIDTDYYLRSFFAGVNIRPSCTQCAFRKRYRNSDITIWDCFDVYKFSKELDNDKGVTRLLTHSKQGEDIVESMRKDMRIIEISPDKAVEGVKEIYHSVVFHPKREAFFSDLNRLSPEVCFKKYFPITLRHRFEKQVRLWCDRLGIYQVMKRLFKALHGNKEIKR